MLFYFSSLVVLIWFPVFPAPLTTRCIPPVDLFSFSDHHLWVSGENTGSPSFLYHHFFFLSSLQGTLVPLQYLIVFLDEGVDLIKHHVCVIHFFQRAFNHFIQVDDCHLNPSLLEVLL